MFKLALAKSLLVNLPLAKLLVVLLSLTKLFVVKLSLPKSFVVKLSLAKTLPVKFATGKIMSGKFVAGKITPGKVVHSRRRSFLRKLFWSECNFQSLESRFHDRFLKVKIRGQSFEVKFDVNLVKQIVTRPLCLVESHTLDAA